MGPELSALCSTYSDFAKKVSVVCARVTIEGQYINGSVLRSLVCRDNSRKISRRWLSERIVLKLNAALDRSAARASCRRFEVLQRFSHVSISNMFSSYFSSDNAYYAKRY